MLTAWHTPGMGSPCWVEVGDSSAPVPQNRIFFSFPSFSCPSRYPHNVMALHPQPEPPAWTSCLVLSNTRVPQSVSLPLLETIIYVADYMEPNRDFPGVEKLRKLAYTDIQAALKLGLEMTMDHLKKQGSEVSPESRETLAYLNGRKES